MFREMGWALGLSGVWGFFLIIFILGALVGLGFSGLPKI